MVSFLKTYRYAELEALRSNKDVQPLESSATLMQLHIYGCAPGCASVGHTEPSAVLGFSCHMIAEYRLPISLGSDYRQSAAHLPSASGSQIASPGEYKLCMLQFWVPPEGPKGNVVVLGVDEIGTVVVQDLKARKPPAGPAQAEKAAEAAELEMAELRRENLLLPVVPVANEQAKSSTAAGASSDTAMQTERHAAKTGTDEA